MDVYTKKKQFNSLKAQYHALKAKMTHAEYKALIKEFKEKGENSSMEALNLESFRQQILILGAEITDDLKKITEEARV